MGEDFFMKGVDFWIGVFFGVMKILGFGIFMILMLKKYFFGGF